MKKKMISILLVFVVAITYSIIVSSITFADNGSTENEPLCFTAEESNSSVKLVKEANAPDVSLQYKENDGVWMEYIIGNPINLTDVGDKVYFKATSENEVISTKNTSEKCNRFEMTGKIAASGNVMSLLSSNCTSLAGKTYCFTLLFKNCSSLVKAPILPAETLDEFCYDGMFEGCSSLTKAPELPAKILAKFCYGNMFNSCTKLKLAPVLPAETLGVSCYNSMFMNCVSLTTPPELPAETLANSCYNKMFSGCTGLIAAPELPAETLADSCYMNMFDGCNSLIVAPELPAVTLAVSCYGYMFKDCSSLDVTTSGGGSECYNHFRITNPDLEKFPGDFCYQMFPNGVTPEFDTNYYFAAHDLLYVYETNKHYIKCKKCDFEHLREGREHIFDEPVVKDGFKVSKCTLCGYERYEEGHTHSFSNEWSNSSDYHWHAASCEHKEFTSGFDKHNYDDGTYVKGVKISTCKTCGYEKKEKMTLVVPKTTLNVTAGKKYITAKWTKKSVTGYQLQYGLTSNFKGAKTLTIKPATKVSQKISNLKSKKKYYIRIRCFTNKYDTTYYSAWASKSVVVK